MKPTHINDIKSSNSKQQGRINNNNNPSNQQSLLLHTLKTRWVSMLLFVLGALAIFNYVPDANNYKALAAMLWTSIYTTWVYVGRNN
jgi:hypothetical protein